MGRQSLERRFTRRFSEHCTGTIFHGLQRQKPREYKMFPKTKYIERPTLNFHKYPRAR